MRRLLAILLLSVMCLLPVLSCVPGGYEGENPNRPDDQQVTVDEPQEEGEVTPEPVTMPDEPEEPSGE